jgi:hypothetical protein
MSVIVREACGFGRPCAVLGTLVSETSTRYIYRRRPDGPIAFAYRRSPALHIEPCKSCPDHPASRYGYLREDTAPLVTSPRRTTTPSSERWTSSLC